MNYFLSLITVVSVVFAYHYLIAVGSFFVKGLAVIELVL